MESNRMKRTADARSMSKKNLVFAFVQLGHDYDKQAEEIKDLRLSVDAQKSTIKVLGERVKERENMPTKLARAYQTIRLMRQLIAHSFDEGES